MAVIPPPSTPLFFPNSRRMTTEWYNFFSQLNILIQPTKTSSYIEFAEMTAPASPPANSARLYAEDSGGGKTQLTVLFPTGVAQVIKVEP